MADLIDRQAAREKACAGCTRHGDYGECYDPEPCARLHMAFIMAETVDAVPVRHGQWVRDEEKDMKHCSGCGYRVYFTHNYCPSCGVKMDQESENE